MDVINELLNDPKKPVMDIIDTKMLEVKELCEKHGIILVSAFTTGVSGSHYLSNARCVHTMFGLLEELKIKFSDSMRMNMYHASAEREELEEESDRRYSKDSKQAN